MVEQTSFNWQLKDKLKKTVEFSFYSALKGKDYPCFNILHLMKKDILREEK